MRVTRKATSGEMPNMWVGRAGSLTKAGTPSVFGFLLVRMPHMPMRITVVLTALCSRKNTPSLICLAMPEPDPEAFAAFMATASRGIASGNRLPCLRMHSAQTEETEAAFDYASAAKASDPPPPVGVLVLRQPRQCRAVTCLEPSLFVSAPYLSQKQVHFGVVGRFAIPSLLAQA